MKLFLILFITLIPLSNSHAETVFKNIQSGFKSSSLQAMNETLSCNHLKLLIERRYGELMGSSNERSIMNEDQLDEFEKCLNNVIPIPILELSGTNTYRVRYELSDEIEKTWLSDTQAIVYRSNGFFDFQLPNGEFRSNRFSFLKNQNSTDSLEFDITAYDLCLRKWVEVILYSDCPLEIIQFDTCNYQNGICTGTPTWKSKPFVVEFNACRKIKVLKFDLTELGRTHGRRGLK